MENYDEYRQRLISPEEAAGLVRSGMWIDYGHFCGFPRLMDNRLAKRARELQDVKIRAWASLTEPEVLKADPEQKHFIYNSWQFSAVERKYHDRGLCSYLPSHLSEMPKLYREHLKGEVDIAFLEVSPMDKYGYFNFGTAISYQKAICDVARTVVVEVNESQPWVYGGYDEAIHISQTDYIVENKEYEIAELPAAKPTKTDEDIARCIAGLIEDEATIQLGMGVIPDMVGKLLVEHGAKDLGIHTGIFTDSMVDLIEAGMVTNKKKSINPGKAVLCCAMGSKRLYRFLDHNPALAGYPSDYANNPYIIARNRKQISVNSALKIDLKGQVCSESSGYRQISGTGGQLDWTRGAYMSPGGKALICLHSTRTDKEGKRISNIMPALEMGDMITVPATDVSYVVTEFGIVNLKGRSTWERAKLLISIAHPDFRHELQEAAGETGLITRGTARI